MGLTLCQKLKDASLTKTENCILFGLSNNVQIWQACGILNYRITNGIEDFQRQHLQR